MIAVLLKQWPMCSRATKWFLSEMGQLKLPLKWQRAPIVWRQSVLWVKCSRIAPLRPQRADWILFSWLILYIFFFFAQTCCQIRMRILINSVKSQILFSDSLLFFLSIVSEHIKDTISHRHWTLALHVNHGMQNLTENKRISVCPWRFLRMVHVQCPVWTWLDEKC